VRESPNGTPSLANRQDLALLGPARRVILATIHARNA